MRYSALVTILFALLTSCTPQSAPEVPLDLNAAAQRVAEEAEEDQKRADMLRIFGYDAALVSRLNQAFDKRDQEAGEWIRGEKGQRLVTLEAEIARAAHAKDLQGVRNAIAQAKPLRSELRQLFASHQETILASLTEQQRVQWHGYEVSSKMLGLMEPLALSGEQIAAIEVGGPDVVSQAMQRGEPNVTAAAFLALESWAENSVLTPEQRTAYAGIKDQNKMRSLGV